MEKGFYSNEFFKQLELSDLISIPEGQKQELNFSLVRLINKSPTLNFALEKNGDTFVLSSLRKKDSYSRYAQTPTQHSLGNALYNIASVKTSSDALVNLIGELDFSDPAAEKVQSTKDVLPNVYLDAQKAELEQTRRLSNLLSSGLPEEGAWLKPIASFTDRSGTDQINGYNIRQAGAVGGFRAKISEQLETGLFLGVSELNLKEDNTGSHYDSTTFSFGAEARYNSPAVPRFTAFGSLFTGVTDSKTTKKSLAETYKGKWTGFSFGTQFEAELLFGQKGLAVGALASVDYVFNIVQIFQSPAVLYRKGYRKNLAAKSAHCWG